MVEEEEEEEENVSITIYLFSFSRCIVQVKRGKVREEKPTK
jgi:hypothetical protein